MKRSLWILVAALIMLCGVATLFTRPSQTEAERYLADLQAFLRTHDHHLQAYSSEVLAGRVPQRTGFSGYEPPSVSSGRISLITVTRDTNANVYFVTDSMPGWNVGFILRRGDAELEGDQMHSRIVFSQRLFGDWWYYKSS